VSPAPRAAGRRRVLAHLVSLLAAGAAGALFGAGLLVSGMTQPARVLAFLDVTRRWDPRLALVMAAAVLVYALAYRRIRRRGAPWLGPQLHLPAPGAIDPPLVLGAALFGVGWGLAGLCPGPAFVSAASGSVPALAFAAAMLAGMHVQHRSSR
jgi:uncharacterized membrane protein YedE/YeeE